MCILKEVTPLSPKSFKKVFLKASTTTAQKKELFSQLTIKKYAPNPTWLYCACKPEWWLFPSNRAEKASYKSKATDNCCHWLSSNTALEGNSWIQEPASNVNMDIFLLNVVERARIIFKCSASGSYLCHFRNTMTLLLLHFLHLTCEQIAAPPNYCFL